MTGGAMCPAPRSSFSGFSVALNGECQMKYLLALLCLMLAGSWSAEAKKAPSVAPLVMLISVDGMKPEAVIDAQKFGLKVPNLRAFMTDGSYASGVRGVLPTLTYP